MRRWRRSWGGAGGGGGRGVRPSWRWLRPPRCCRCRPRPRGAGADGAARWSSRRTRFGAHLPGASHRLSTNARRRRAVAWSGCPARTWSTAVLHGSSACEMVVTARWSGPHGGSRRLARYEDDDLVPPSKATCRWSGRRVRAPTTAAPRASSASTKTTTRHVEAAGAAQGGEGRRPVLGEVVGDGADPAPAPPGAAPGPRPSLGLRGRAGGGRAAAGHGGGGGAGAAAGSSNTDTAGWAGSQMAPKPRLGGDIHPRVGLLGGARTVEDVDHDAGDVVPSAALVGEADELGDLRRRGRRCDR